MPTHKEVAEWMLQRLEKERYLYQEIIVYDIEGKFGDGFTYVNNNGNLAVDRRVLREFRRLTERNVIWERGERMWRYREGYDPPDKRQVD